MNKCEHGQKIAIFCASECCVWKQAAGCDFCMKKYHNHMGTTIFLKEEEVLGLVKKYTMDSNIKPKSRILQQSIFSYFNLLKTEFTNSIDVVCKNIMSQIGYPYLFSNNVLSTYKRLKNKEYKKIIQKQFKNLYELSQKNNEKEIVQEEAKIYYQSVKKTEQLLLSLDQIFKNYEAVVKKTYSNFTHDNSYLLRINDIFKNLITELPSKISILKENKEAEPTKSEHISLIPKQKFSPKVKTEFTVNNQNTPSRLPMISIPPPLLLKPNYGKNVSIGKKIVSEHSFASASGIKTLRQQTKEIVRKQDNDKSSVTRNAMNNKEIQINQKKRMLIDMMKHKEDKNVKQKSNNELLEKKEADAAKFQVSFFKRQISERSPQRSPQIGQVQKIPQIEINIKTLTDESPQNSHKELELDENNLKQDDNEIHQQAFTQLPLLECDLEKFQQIKQVKEKVIFIPRPKELEELESNIGVTESPILKKRNQSNIFKSKDIQTQGQDKKEEKLLQAVKQSSIQNETLQLKENEEKSLALLLKSLALNAEEAIKYLESSLSQADNNLSAAQYLSFLYLQQDKPQNCIHLCNKMLERLENSSQPQQLSLILNNNKAAALNVIGRYSQSIMILQKCLRYQEKDVLFKNLGDAYYSISIYEKAIYNYEKALKLNQFYDQAQYNMAVCLYIQENYFNAKLSIQKALQIHSKNAKYLQLLYHIETRITNC